MAESGRDKGAVINPDTGMTIESPDGGYPSCMDFDAVKHSESISRQNQGTTVFSAKTSARSFATAVAARCTRRLPGSSTSQRGLNLCCAPPAFASLFCDPQSRRSKGNSGWWRQGSTCSRFPTFVLLRDRLFASHAEAGLAPVVAHRAKASGAGEVPGPREHNPDYVFAPDGQEDAGCADDGRKVLG